MQWHCIVLYMCVGAHMLVPEGVVGAAATDRARLKWGTPPRFERLVVE